MKVFCCDNQKISCFESLHLRISGCVYSMEILCVMQRQCGCWTWLSTCLRTLDVFLWLPNITRYCEVVILYVGHFWFLEKLWSSDESQSFLLVYAWFTDQFWGTLFTSWVLAFYGSGYCRHLWEGGKCPEGNGVLWEGCWALFWWGYWQHCQPMQDKGCPVCCTAWTVHFCSLLSAFLIASLVCAAIWMSLAWRTCCMPCKQPEFAGLEDSLHCSFFVLLLFQCYTQLIPSILFVGFLHCKHGWRLRFGNGEILARYNKAIAIYEDVAKQSMSNNLLKYSVKGYLLNAGLCQICGKDVVAIYNALEKYQVCFLPVLPSGCFCLLSQRQEK